MIYPKKINSKKIDVFFRILSGVLILVSILLVVINVFATPNIYWSPLCILGFIYTYLTVKYSITKKTNIAHHVMIQTVLTSILLFVIDYRLGYKGWSASIALPILILFANASMFAITITNYKHYAKYATSQLIITMLSILLIFLVHYGQAKLNALVIITIVISSIGFILSLILCHRDFKEEIIRKFNI